MAVVVQAAGLLHALEDTLYGLPNCVEIMPLLAVTSYSPEEARVVVGSVVLPVLVLAIPHALFGSEGTVAGGTLVEVPESGVAADIFHWDFAMQVGVPSCV